VTKVTSGHLRKIDSSKLSACVHELHNSITALADAADSMDD